MRSIEELRSEMQNKKTIDDLVMAIMFKSQKHKIPKSQAFLQQAFFKLREKNPRLLSEFIFDESGITPFSDELDAVRFRLEASAILPTPNPTYKKYDLTDSLGMLEKSYGKFCPNTKDIDECAAFFAELVDE